MRLALSASAGSIVALAVACASFSTAGSEPSQDAGAEASPSDANAAAEAADGGVRADGGGLPTGVRLVFVSQQLQNSSTLRDVAQVCNAELLRVGRRSGFAWVQTASGTSPADRIAADPYDGPWILPSGKEVFRTKADITGGSGAEHAIDETVGRTLVSGTAWSGLQADGGVVAGGNCGGWTSSLGSTPVTTLGGVGSNWARSDTSADCHSQQYVICFEAETL